MEFRIATEELGRALHRGQGIVDRKTTMPILANVLIQARKAGVTVTAFDLDIGVVSEHAAEVTKEGAVTLSARHLYDMVKLLPDARVTLRAAGGKVDITSGSAHFRLVGMPAEDYPPLPKEEKASFFKVDGKTLLAMILRTRYAVSRDETRYVLNGVLFEPVGPNAARMVATDGHRLSMIERSMSGEFTLQRPVIIPHKGLDELRRLLEEAPEAECSLGVAESSAMFKKPGLSMVMRLIDGQFPEYQQVIPRESDHSVKLPRLRLLETLRRTSLLSSDRAYAVKVTLSPGAFKLACENSDLGDAHEEIPVEYRGKPLTIGFNARYLMDVLEVTETDDVVFDVSDEHSPGVLRPAGDPSFTAVVMPMRI